MRKHEKAQEGVEPKSGNLLDLTGIDASCTKRSIRVKSSRGFLLFCVQVPQRKSDGRAGGDRHGEQERETFPARFVRKQEIACFLFSFHR